MAKSTEPDTSAPKAPSRGIKIVLIAAYGLLAVAATGRSVFQIVTKFNEAPLAYSLSLVAAIVYIVATVALLRPGTTWRRVAVITMTFELVGVVVVGALSEFQPQLFHHPSVWSYFGEGYLLIPLALPILGLIWMSRNKPGATTDIDTPKNRDS